MKETSLKLREYRKKVELAFEYLDYLLGSKDTFYPNELQSFREVTFDLTWFIVSMLSLNVLIRLFTE